MPPFPPGRWWPRGSWSARATPRPPTPDSTSPPPPTRGPWGPTGRGTGGPLWAPSSGSSTSIRNPGSEGTTRTAWTTGSRSCWGRKQTRRGCTRRRAASGDLSRRPSPPEQNFFLEMQQLVHRALRENHQHDNSMLEIKALKFAYNRSFQDCVRGTVRGFVTYFDDGVRSSKEFKDDVLRVLKKCGETASRKAEEGWTSVFRKFVAAETDCEVQLEMLEELVDLAKKRKVMQLALVHLLMFFHQEDVLSGEGILRWVAQVDQRGTAEERAIRAKCDRFIEWLQQGDEEEEDDDP
eukprot:TRINITY_DN14456_c0_g1_i1.p1 TRINITY_DN14456_c0_g1~~TRINITY_DN14456_c0_g1_i1.p1  ORF type:complete len:294 (+),score=50.19 TRINITY_DN14456_c0_g1_i1:179-1060(+)